jgi:molybdopterin-guanine dinucleotide biosynthesis protein A
MADMLSTMISGAAASTRDQVTAMYSASQEERATTFACLTVAEKEDDPGGPLPGVDVPGHVGVSVADQLEWFALLLGVI